MPAAVHRLHLVDGTYELFRAFFGSPPQTAPDGSEVGATVGLLRSLLALVRDPETTHVACAFDHVIESFRNQMFAGYKTGEGIDPKLLAQFELAERASRAAGFVVWPMVEFEADDALASGAERFKSRVDRVIICSPDKDLAQCVESRRVVAFNRRTRQLLDERGVWDKFGVAPASIPDWLALVGDSADGLPGVPGWGAKSSSAILSRYPHLEDIPHFALEWQVRVRGGQRLAGNLRKHWEKALLYRQLATLRRDVPLEEELEDLRWRGAHRADLDALCRQLGEPDLKEAVPVWQD